MTFIPNDATRAQIEAARPDVSTWLTANAGSGKTRVLTDRVARLLLKGVDPQQILCLTYTKAAASEMQNRLFKRLGEWAMREDGPLRDDLRQLGIESDLPPEQLREARTLFARAIETPGGLKIQTIHSFCAAILRRFPLEARVSPQFSEIEDRAADLLRAEIVDAMAAEGENSLVADVARFYTGEDFASLTKGIVGLRDAFRDSKTGEDLSQLLGQPPTLGEDQILNSVFVGGEMELIRELVPHLLAKGGNDAKAAGKLTAVTSPNMDALPVLEGVFLTGSGANAYMARIGKFPTKPTQNLVPHLMPALDAFMQRIEDAREARLTLAAVQRTMALHHFARSFLSRYEAEKEARGWLDFDDLIFKTRELLTNPSVAAWVLYRIDGGIDHILVDEAQDTSPRQWDIIERLTEEFYSGVGSTPVTDRTLFVVGDKKQSIYSFQGADPDELDRKAISFAEKIEAAGKTFQTCGLEYSFRSASAVLRAVDQTFDPRILDGFDKESQHKAFKDALPGRVDLWPVIEKSDDKDDRNWTDPVDRLSPQHHTVILAEKIAAEIKQLTNGKHFIPDDDTTSGTFNRPIRAGDFLILVQRRGPLFAEIIRACKAAGLPIAGADRLKVGAELAVKDLGALLAFLATPDDDLSLATALRSPLFGWSEQQLFDLAHGRDKNTRLWQVLRGQGDLHANTIGILRDLRSQIDFLRPFDLIERILTRHDGRSRLLSRLGPEAEDGINALLSQALGYERNEVPSLTGFLEWMQTDELEIKRQIDSSSNQIRVMSVHGAKGLEAPIVILPDTAQRTITIKDEIIELEDIPFWKPKAADLPDAMQNRIDELKKAQRRERLRLLYVAMTRAEKWLIVAAAGDLAKDRSDWYQIMETAMGHLGSVDLGDDGARRYEEGDWDNLPVVAQFSNSEKSAVLETIFSAPVPQNPNPDPILSPSDLGGAKALPGEAGEDQEVALAYGSLVHHLLEIMPVQSPSDQHKLAQSLSKQWPADMLSQALAEAQAVLKDDTLKILFAPDTLAEVSITASIGGNRLHGTIDRLLIEEDRVRAIDFKSNRVVPTGPETCPEGILRQMGAYAVMLQQIYPDQQVETAIVWTNTRDLMVLPHDIVTEALRRSPHLDGTGRPS